MSIVASLQQQLSALPAMTAPVWLVTGIKNVQRKALADAYTNNAERMDLWRVQFQNGFFAGEGMNLFFETQPQADQFAPWQLYTPKQIMEIIPPTESFVASGVSQTWWQGAYNQWTQEVQKAEAWIASLEDVNRNRYMDLRFPNPAQAAKYGAKGKVFSMLDMFGTLPSVPRAAVEQLQALAEQAQQAAQAAQLAEQQAEYAAQQQENTFEQDNIEQAQQYQSVALAEALAQAQADEAAATSDVTFANSYYDNATQGTQAQLISGITALSQLVTALGNLLADAQTQTLTNPAAGTYATQIAAQQVYVAKLYAALTALAAKQSVLTPNFQGIPHLWPLSGPGSLVVYQPLSYTITNGGSSGYYYYTGTPVNAVTLHQSQFWCPVGTCQRITGLYNGQWLGCYSEPYAGGPM